MKAICVLILFIVIYFNAAAQLYTICDSIQNKHLGNNPQRTTKGTFYVTGGYNLDWYAKGTIHFKDLTTDNYDFKLSNVKAVDRDGLQDVLHEDITIPQYSFRIGYWFNNKYDLGIELNYDHAKYVMLRDQNLHLSGMIDGKEYDQDTIVGSNFLTFEHSNGANFCLVNIVKRANLLHSKNNKFWLGAVFKYGFGFVYPRSDVTIFGINRNDKYHVAGYITGVEAGLRFDFCKYFFLETTGKGVFANYTNVLVTGEGRAKHKVYGFEYIFLCGIQFPL